MGDPEGIATAPRGFGVIGTTGGGTGKIGGTIEGGVGVGAGAGVEVKGGVGDGVGVGVIEAPLSL